MSSAGSRSAPKRTYAQVDTENSGNGTDLHSNSSVGGTQNIGNAEDLHGGSSVGELKR